MIEKLKRGQKIGSYQPPSKTTPPEEKDQGSVSLPKGGLAVRAQITLPLDLKVEAGGMIMYLITSDRLDSIESGSGSSASRAFSAVFAVFLTVVSLMVGAKIRNADLGSLATLLWGLLFSSGGLSAYFYRESRRREIRAKDMFKDIREKSATVVGLPRSHRQV